MKTTLWIDGGEKITVNKNVTDLDEASIILGFVDYQDLLSEHCSEQCSESPINFEWTAEE